MHAATATTNLANFQVLFIQLVNSVTRRAKIRVMQGEIPSRVILVRESYEGELTKLAWGEWTSEVKRQGLIFKGQLLPAFPPGHGPLLLLLLEWSVTLAVPLSWTMAMQMRCIACNS
jgi:hypothetical protein